MKKAQRTAHTLIILLTVVCCPTASATTTDDAPLGDVDLGPSPPAVFFNLSNATINITIAEGRSPRLRWWQEDPAEPGATELSPAADGDRIIIERPPTDENTTPARLLLDLSLDSSATGITIAGSDLDLTVGNRIGVEESPSLAAPDTDRGPAPAIELQLSDSVVKLAGIRGIHASLQDCLARTTGSFGMIDLEVSGGELSVEQHQGNVRIGENQATVTIGDAQGTVHVRAGQGSVIFRSIQGPLTINSDGAHVQVERLHGTGSVTAVDSSIDIRDSSSTRLSINTTSSYLTLTNTTATATFEIRGGSLTVDDGKGAFNGTCRESADLAVTEFTGDARLSIVDFCRSDLRRIHGAVAAKISSAELTIDVVQSLSFTADEARITGSGIGELKKAKADRSEVELDLTECASRSLALQAGEQSFVRVQLASPCRVRTKGIDPSTSNQVRVTGCEYQLGKSRRWATRNVRGIDGNLPVMLVANMAASAELDVDGRP